MNQKIGIFGGTFDPVHWGHLHLAATAKAQADLDQLLWIPAWVPPHKSDRPLAEFHHRVAMLQRAIAGDTASTISTIEAERSFPSYSADTWQQLQKQYPAAQWYWIVGSDTLRTLSHWYRRTELVRHCCWLVAPRSLTPSHPHTAPQIQSLARQIACHTCDRLAQESLKLHWQLLEMTPIEISSTQIRQAVRQKRSLATFVPDTVADYIATHQLYQDHYRSPLP